MWRGTSIERLHQRALLVLARDAALAAEPEREQASTASWQVKALVEATPISGPASVGSAMSDSRAIEEVRTLTIEAMRWPFGLGVAQRRERVRGLARLRHEERQAARWERRLAVAHLGGDVDLDGEARVALDPVLADEAGVVGGAACRERHARQRLGVDAELRQVHGAGAHVDVVRQRVRRSPRAARGSPSP